MRSSSACGIGKTGTVALLAALDHFGDLLLASPDSRSLDHDAYSAVTSRCIEACPTHVNVPRYIDYIRDGHPELAMGVVLKHYPLVGSCGRVCVRLCETACRRNTFDTPVDIKNLKRFAADKSTASFDTLFAELQAPLDSNSLRVAIIGAGPAGVTCAYHLLQRGYHVDLFEASPSSRERILPYARDALSRAIPARQINNAKLSNRWPLAERKGSVSTKV